MTRVMVTGPSGFIGTHCLRRLLTEDCEIHAVNRAGKAPSNGRIGDLTGDRVNSNVTWHAADLRDAAQAASIVAKVRPTHLLHCAWIATPQRYEHSPENNDWLQSSIAMASAFGVHGGVRFVGVGSSAEYALSDLPCVEDETPILPSTLYGNCKAACWLAVQATAQRYGFSAGWGRPFLPYGPGEPMRRLVPTVIASLLSDQPVRTTHGTQRRDFIYAPDAADLLIRLLLSSEPGAFNIGTGQATTVRFVVEYLAARLGKPQLLRFGAIQSSPGDPPVLVADMTKVHDRLGWSAPTSLRDGLNHVLDAAE